MSKAGVKGGKELAKAFREAGKEILSLTEIGLESACLFVEGDAKKRAPVDTGMLRNSISHRVRKEGLKAIGEVGTATEYAVPIEFGTAKMEPQPFLTPSVEENKQTITDIIARQIKRKL